MKSSKKWIVTVVLMVVIVVLVAGIRYFGLDKKNVLDQGEVRLTDTQEITGKMERRVDWKLEEIATNLIVPWSIVFPDLTRILVSQRTGEIVQIVNGKVDPNPLIYFPVSSNGEEGLMGLSLDPNYNTNRWMYACFAYDVEGSLRVKVVKLFDQESSLTEVGTVIDQIPAAKFHAGCRLGFGPDDKLYITTGDATNKELAQDLNSLAGKILRLNADGTVPADNPFNNSPIYSYGHRNPQGIDWHPETGQMYSSEHGPSIVDGPAGGDEINAIQAGDNYGWPKVSHDKRLEGTNPPLIQFTPAEAPGSLLVYSGKVFPQYTNQLFFGALKGEGIVRVRLDADGKKVVELEKLDIAVGRVRDVVESPEGYIYFTTSNTDGRGEVRGGDDKVYRLIPKNL
jgi:glucose/arabinose dehydrogenase